MEQNRVTTNAKRKWILAFAICLCAALGTYVNVFSLIGFAVCIGVVLFCSNDEVLFVLLFSMSFANIFKISPSAQSLFTYIMIGYVGYQLFRGDRLSYQYCMALFPLLIFLSAQFLLSVHILRTIKFVVNLLFIYLALQDGAGHERDVFCGYIGGVISSSAIAKLGLLPRLGLYIQDKTTHVGSEYMVRFAGMYADPNYYSVNLIIALCLVVILFHRKEMKPVTAASISLILFFFAIMTYSKSAFLMLLIPVMMFLYCNNISGRYALQLACVAGLVFFVIYAISGKIDFLSTVMSRIQNADNLNQLTTGRFDLWKKYMNSFSKSFFRLLMGNGFGARLVGGKAAHNTYLDFLHYLGIVGTFLVVHLLRVTSAEFSRRIRRRIFLNYSVLIVILIMYFFLSELFYFDMSFHILLAIIVLNMDLHRKNSA